MILDELYDRYDVEYPFQITRFRTLLEHHWEGEFTFLGESHNFWEFSCVLEGEVTGVQGEKVYLTKAGNFGGCPPMVFHSSRNMAESTRILNFSFEHIGTVPQNLAEGMFYLTPAEIDELKDIFRRLQQAFQGETKDHMMGAEATNALTSFLIRVSMNHTPHNRSAKNHSSVTYQKLVETMRSTLCENLSVKEIALRNAISVTTMKELFRKYAGIGPKRYYAQMRGIEALRLLEAGMEISAVAEKLNYSSPNYFSVSFKKQFGAPPGQYRKEH